MWYCGEEVAENCRLDMGKRMSLRMSDVGEDLSLKSSGSFSWAAGIYLKSTITIESTDNAFALRHDNVFAANCPCL